MAVLIAQLQRSQVLKPDDFDMMKRRLIEGGDEVVAGAIDAVLMSDLIDDPGRRRATMHVISADDSAGG